MSGAIDLGKRVISSFRQHGMTDWGASLTYYMVMSLFPGLLVGVSLLSLFGQQSTVTESVEYLRDAGAPKTVVDSVRASLETLVETSGAKAGLALVFGLLIGLNGASGAFGAAGRALNAAFAVDEDRGFVRRKLVDIAWTVVVIVLAAVALLSVFLGGTVARDLFGTIGLGETAASVWIYARWLVALAAMMVTFAIVFAFAPDLPQRRFRWISPGAVLGVLIWLLASAAFFLYVRNFSNYGATYGAFAGAVILLLWLYISSLAFLLGAELNGAIERSQLAGRGGPPPVTPPPSPEVPVPPATAPPAARDPGAS
jgi:membrane protein